MTERQFWTIYLSILTFLYVLGVGCAKLLPYIKGLSPKG